MPILSRELRKHLENTVVKARREAEKGAQKALEQLAVHHNEPWPSLSPEQRTLRNRLRAHGRQLGDRRDGRGTQTIDRLKAECAYEHWHRMLFARFLAECDVLIEPETGMAITLEECRELALERGADWLSLASEFAVRMLPQIFRAGDPVLEISLPPETRQQLEELLKGLSSAVFTADDSLGWVYQFWQKERKGEVDRDLSSGSRVGADEIPAKTQLFTEDYMVLFLLHNSLGAWWAARKLASTPELAALAQSEEELRKACSIGDYEWSYLRFVRDGENRPWRPAAGTFDSWPRAAKELKVLDPCMGSGHFLVFALPILVGFRMEEERLAREQAVEAVLRDNLFGLELDNRCTKIAAFNVALTAWRMTGYRSLPSLNLACSGLGINAKEEDWLKLAISDERAKGAMRKLYHVFEQAPILGSLINPKQIGGDLFAAEFEQVRPLLEKALFAEQTDETVHELAVTATGLMKAAQLLVQEFTLVTTNVPFLKRGKQEQGLQDFCEAYHDDAKGNLACTMLDRCLQFCGSGGLTAVVVINELLFLGTYRKLRKHLLTENRWAGVARLGPGAFEMISGEVVNVSLLNLFRSCPKDGSKFFALDLRNEPTPLSKSVALRFKPFDLRSQKAQLGYPDARIILGELDGAPLLGTIAAFGKGSTTGDSPHYHRCFWELPRLTHETVTWLDSPTDGSLWSGRYLVTITRLEDPRLLEENGSRIHGQEVWGRLGVAVNKMSALQPFLYSGEVFDDNIGVICPSDEALIPAILSYCGSPQYKEDLREIDQAIKVTAATLVKVPFDIDTWKQVAAEQFPHGLPNAHSDDPNQWLFIGHPKGSKQPLQVAVARLLGYRWPRQTGSSFHDSPTLAPDGLEEHTDADGIVCLTPVKGEAPAGDRLRALLAAAFSNEWSADKQAELLTKVGFAGKKVEEWLRDGFFEQHCELFQQRPFVWHLWDGLRNGFHALVNYHKLVGSSGEARRTLEKLIYYYLGDWIDSQRTDQKNGVEGADARLAAALKLKSELESIMEGEPPYDLFVRWKPLHEQSIGWEPDVNDGVRINIRPFMNARLLNSRGKNACILRVTPKRVGWEKDRGKEPHRLKEDYPWFWNWDGTTQDFAGGKDFDCNRWNDLHYTRAFKEKARERKSL